MAITRTQLLTSIYKKLQTQYKKGVSRYQVQEAIEIILSLITEALIEGKSVKISGFGCFKVRKSPPKKAKNFRTGEPLFLSPRKTVSFKASPVLKKKL